jgi:hypothetical protein
MNSLFPAPHTEYIPFPSLHSLDQKASYPCVIPCPSHCTVCLQQECRAVCVSVSEWLCLSVSGCVCVGLGRHGDTTHLSLSRHQSTGEIIMSYLRLTELEPLLLPSLTV